MFNLTSQDAIGIAIAALGEEHLMTFMLSSPFTARNIVQEKGDVDEVKTDLNISLGLSIGFGLFIGAILGSKATSIFGIVFGVVLYEIYKTRGNLQ